MQPLQICLLKKQPIQAELLNLYSIMQLCILNSKMLGYKAFLQL